MAKKIRSKKMSLLLRLGIFAFSAYVVVSLVGLQMQISQKRQQLASIEEQMEQQRLSNKETERLLGLGDDQAYLSRIARERLDMGLPDEHVFRDAAGS